MNGQNDKLKGTTQKSEQKPVHEINILSREKMSITGVKEVMSFDDCGASLSTVDGELTVEGEGIKIGALDTSCGRVSLSGKINGLYYSSDSVEKKKGMLKRLFG